MAKMLPRDDKVDGLNPYNQNKPWSEEGKTGKKFQSADDGLAYVEDKKYAVFNPKGTEEVEEEQQANEAAPAQEEPAPYQKVDYKKRYDDLKRHHDKKINEFKQKIDELKKSDAPHYTPPKSLEDLENWKKENPDMYAVVESVAHLRTTQEIQEMQEELGKIKEKLQYEEARAAYAELKALVPDFEEIRQNEDFHKWAEEQPEQVQNWIYNNRTDALLAAKAINLYKAERGVKSASKPQPPIRKPAEQDAAQAVSVGRRVEEPQSQERVWTTSEISKLHWKEYEKHKAEIDRAWSEGRVIRE